MQLRSESVVAEFLWRPAWLFLLPTSGVPMPNLSGLADSEGGLTPWSVAFEEQTGTETKEHVRVDQQIAKVYETADPF